MIERNLKRIAAGITIAGISALVGCGSNNNSPQSSVGTVPGTVVGAVPGGCIPITTPQIPFTATNIYFSSVNIRGGMIPSSGAIGQMVIGGAPVGGQYQRSGVDGTVSINITPIAQQTPYPGTYYGYGYGTGYGNLGGANTANATGYVSISQLTLQDIIYKFGGMNGAYNPYYPTVPGAVPQPTVGTNSPCVSGIAIDVGHYYNTIYGGNVYLYLNNTQHGYALYF